MDANLPGEQPSQEGSAFSIDLERLSVPEIVFVSRAFADRIPLFNSGDYPNIAAWGHIDDRTHELAQRDPERGRAIYEAYSQSELTGDRLWFLERCLEPYISIDPEAGAFDVWKRLVVDRADNVRERAQQDLRRAFSEDEVATLQALENVGLTLHQGASLLISIVQHEEQLRQQQDPV